VLSLIFWSVMAVVTVKYVAFIMRADNNGEGGSLALLALVTRIKSAAARSWFMTVLGIFAAALFYGDSMITPAISVLSAVEGLEVAAPAPATTCSRSPPAILTGLFWCRARHGQGRPASSARSCACGS
jgi:KUP system potassium uptake protein